jgi:sodium-independent sulfate anion transporter 11
MFPTGFIVNFISTPVTSGFTSAAAITICFTQVKSLLGLSFPAEGFVKVSKGVVEHIHDVKLKDAMVSIVCIVVLLVLRVIEL